MSNLIIDCDMDRVHKFVSVNNSERFGARKCIFTTNICTKSDQEYTVLELSHPFPDNTDSMILKSIKQFVIKIRVPAATLQNADRSTMSSASIQSQSPLSFVNKISTSSFK